MEERRKQNQNLKSDLSDKEDVPVETVEENVEATPDCKEKPTMGKVTFNVVHSWKNVWAKYLFWFVVTKCGCSSLFLVIEKQSNNIILIKESKWIKETCYDLKHPHILESNDNPLMIVDPQLSPAIWIFMEPQAVSSLYNLYENIGRGLNEEEVKEVMRQMVAACAYLESNHLYHDDIQLINFVLTTQGVVKLIDLHSVEHIGYSNKADVFSLGKCICLLASRDTEPDIFEGPMWEMFSADFINCLSSSLDKDFTKRPSFADLQRGYLKDVKPCPILVVEMMAEVSCRQHFMGTVGGKFGSKIESESKSIPVIVEKTSAVQPKVCEGHKFIYTRTVTLILKVHRIVFGYYCDELRKARLNEYLESINNLFLDDDVTSRASRQFITQGEKIKPSAVKRVESFHTLLLENWSQTEQPHDVQIAVLESQTAFCRQRVDIDEFRQQLPQLKNLHRYLVAKQTSKG